MVLIGLLLIALVCLTLGLVLASAGWLIGSLAASAAAAWVLWRGRDRIVPAATGDAAKDDAKDEGTATADADAATAEAGAAMASAPVSDEPDYARRRADELRGVVQPAPAPRFSRTPGAVQRPPAARGAHNAEALADWGFSADDIAALQACGAL